MPLFDSILHGGTVKVADSRRDDGLPIATTSSYGRYHTIWWYGMVP